MAGVARRIGVALIAVVACGLPATAQARFATGGAGRYVPAINWLEWGTAGATLNTPVDATSTTDIGGKDLKVKCTLSNGAGGPIKAYNPGAFSPTAFDDMYNIGGLGGSNTLVAGIAGAVAGGLSTVDFTCSATLAGDPYPLAGVVIADAEQSLTGEYVEGEVADTATWRIIDRFRTAACTSGTPATQTTAGGLTTLQLGGVSPLCADGPSVVAFADGADHGTLRIQGGGTSAVALGAVVAFDGGDAPAGYGRATHLLHHTFSGGTVPAGPATDVSAPGFTLAAANTPSPRVGPDVDPGGLASTLSDNDNTTGSGGVFGPDDDESESPGTISTYAGDIIKRTVTCTGAGATVAGWVDFDASGTFESDERATASCNGTTADVTWVVPSDVVRQALTVVRYRIATDPADVADPTGVAADGEVEDHPTPLAIPENGHQWITGPEGASTPWTAGNSLTGTFGTTGVTGTAKLDSVTGACQSFQFSDGTPTGINPANATKPATPFLYPIPPSTDALFHRVCVNPGGSASIDYKFSKPVVAPIAHFVNIDASQVTLSGQSTTLDPLTTTVAASNHKLGAGPAFNTTPFAQSQFGCSATPADANNGACGSVRLDAPTGFVDDFKLDYTTPAGTTTPDLSWFAVSFPTVDLSAAYASPSLATNGTTSLTFTIANPNVPGAVALNGMAFTELLPPGLVIDSTTTSSSGCGTPAFADDGGGALGSGDGGVKVSGIDVALGATCTMTVHVRGTTTGTKAINPASATTNIGNLVSIVNDSLVVHGPPLATLTGPPVGKQVVVGGSEPIDFGCTGTATPVTCEATVTPPTGPATPILDGADLPSGAPGTYTVTVKATDSVGQVHTVTRTYTVVPPPDVSITSPPVDDVIAPGTPLAAQFGCTGGVAPTTCTGTIRKPNGSAAPVADGSDIDTSAPGVYELIATVVDADGRTKSVTRTFKVFAPPSATPGGVSEGQDVPKGAPLTAGVTCSDGAPPLTCTGRLVRPDGSSVPIGNGDTIDTSVPGTYELDVTATDAAGRVTVRRVRFTVGGTVQTAASGPDAAGLALSCQRAKLALLDVLPAHGRVALTGVADKQFAGRKVSIIFFADKKVVATPTVKPDGTFTATAPMPGLAIRFTNRARYQATLGSEKSLNLKLARRTRILASSTKGAKVTLSGSVQRPFTHPIGTVVLTEQVDCSKAKRVVATFRPNGDGRFSVTIDAPAGRRSARYRVRTKVEHAHGKVFKTFSLPRYVTLG